MFDRFISSFFHPILFPFIGSIFYLYTIPRYITNTYKLIILLVVFVGSYLLPTILLFLFKKLQLIDSFHLKSIEERKFPLLFFTSLSILIGKMLFSIQMVNDLAIYFVAGGFGLLVVYIFLWVQIKVSIHTLGVGALIGFILHLSSSYHYNYLVFLILLFLLFGLIAKARIRLKAHNFLEILLGLLFGVFTQLLVPYIYQNI